MSAGETTRSGRPRLFDEEAVLDSLTELFWHKGFARTSMADIVQTSGVHKPSLYRTFGSKDELFATILHRYLARKMALFAELVDQAGPGVAGIHAFLDNFRSEVLTDSGRHGCLLVVASNELEGTMPGYEDFGAEYRRELRRHLGVLVARARPDGEVDSDLVDARAEVLVTFLLGLHVTIRASAGTGDADRAIDAMDMVVDTWQH